MPPGRPLTPEEEAEYLAQQAAADPPPVEPGMYSEPYVAPGQGLPQVQETPPPPDPAPEPYGQPGHYAPPYVEPGQMAGSPPPPVEPGMYEPQYSQPGYYAPRAASTYYGGDQWPTPYSGTERASTMGTIAPGARRDMIQVIDPSTGERAYRPVTGGGTVIQERENPLPVEWPPPPTPAVPYGGATSRGEILGAMASGGKRGVVAPPVTVPNDRGEAQAAWYDRVVRERQRRGERPRPLGPHDALLRELFGGA